MHKAEMEADVVPACLSDEHVVGGFPQRFARSSDKSVCGEFRDASLMRSSRTSACVRTLIPLLFYSSNSKHVICCINVCCLR